MKGLKSGSGAREPVCRRGMISRTFFALRILALEEEATTSYQHTRCNQQKHDYTAVSCRSQMAVKFSHKNSSSVSVSNTVGSPSSVLTVHCCSTSFTLAASQWGAADAEIKIPSGENTELKRSPFKAWNRSYMLRLLPGISSLLILPFRSIHLHFFPQNLSRFFRSCVGLQNQICHPPGCRLPC